MQDSPERPDKATLIDAIRHNRAELEAAISPLSEEQLVAAPTDEWSIRDHIAHLTAWEQSIVALLQGRPRHKGLGVDRAIYEAHDVDAINSQIYERNRRRTVGDVLAGFQASHQQLLAILAGSSDDDLRKTYSDYLPDEPGEETGAPVVDWVAKNTIHHYREHLDTIRELARSQ